MLDKIDFTTHKFAVIGLGDTGLAIINYLQYKAANITVVIDSREKPPHYNRVAALGLNIYLGELTLELFADVDIIVLSPGVSAFTEVLSLVQRHNKFLLSDVELFAREIISWPSKVAAITGSNGKTTVTTMVNSWAQASGLTTLMAGNVGIPVLDAYLAIAQGKCAMPDLIVLELSSFQLEAIYNLHLDVATVLNIAPDHLDRYRDLLQYAYVKSNIFNNAKVQMLNYDDQFVVNMQRPAVPQIFFTMCQSAKKERVGSNKNIHFSLVTNEQTNTDYLQLTTYDQQGQLITRPIIDCKELTVLGKHNNLNCLAALAILHALQIDIFAPQLLHAVVNFHGLAHRMQKIAQHNGITYVEDSKATNVASVLAGVAGLNTPVNLILGGQGKGQDFRPLYQLVAAKCRSVALIGTDAKLIAQALSGLDTTVALKHCQSMSDAVDFAIANAQVNDYVVLSPACASFDMFTNYEHRANVFIDLVKTYVNQKRS